MLTTDNCPLFLASSTKVPVAHARLGALPDRLSTSSSPRMNSGDVSGHRISLGTCARRARANPLARSGRAFAGQRATYGSLPPPSIAAQPGKAGGYRARPADRSNQVAGARDRVIRNQPDATAPERAPDSGADRPHRQRGGFRGRTQGHPPAGKFCRKQSRYVHLPDGGREVRKRHERVTGKFPGRAGSVRGESAAAGLRHLPAIEATAGGQVSQRSSGIGSPKPAGLRRGRAFERRERQLYGNAGRGRFPGTHPSSFAGSQRAGTHRFSSGSQRPPRGPPGDEKLRSWRGRQQQFTCGKSEGAASGAPQHGNGAFYRNGQETPGRDDRNVQYFS